MLLPSLKLVLPLSEPVDLQRLYLRPALPCSARTWNRFFLCRSHASVCAAKPRGRRSQQRVARRQRQSDDVQGAIRSLNWLWRAQTANTAAHDEAEPTGASCVQALGLVRVKCHVMDAVREPAERPSPQAAFAELLRGRSVYNDHSGLSGISVARYSHVSNVSLPESFDGCPPLRELLPECERHFWMTA